MTTDQLISEIEACAMRTGLSPATITRRAVENSRLYQRLKEGGDCSLTVAHRLRDWMADQPSVGGAETRGDAA